MEPGLFIEINALAQSQLFAAGLTIATLVTLVLARRIGVWWAYVPVSLVAAVAGAGVGGRLVSLAIAPEATDPAWWNPLAAGYSSLGALVGAGIVGLGVFRLSGHSFARGVELFVPGGLMALSLTRIGCLWRGCDFGKPGPFGVRYREGSDPWRHYLQRGDIAPTELATPILHALPIYLASAAFVGGMIAFALAWRRRPGAGWLGAAFYFMIRAFSESFRESAHVVSANLVISSCLALAAFVGFWVYKRGDTLP